MPKMRVHCFTISLDGYGAGPNQGMDHPLGVGALDLHKWMVPTRTFQQMHGSDNKTSGVIGIDDDFTARGVTNIGAWIMGRNMFGPFRGPWQDEAPLWWSWYRQIPPTSPPRTC